MISLKKKNCGDSERDKIIPSIEWVNKTFYSDCKILSFFMSQQIKGEEIFASDL